MIAVYAGSFSPPTLGHLDVIRRAAGIFDELVVAVLSQQAKQYLFTPQQRLEMLRQITTEFKNVRVIADTGLLVDVAHREGADVIVRGLRNSSDLLFEMQMAEANRQIGKIETVFISCLPEYSMISSTIVRDCAAHGAPIDSMVPEEIIGKIYAAYGVKPCAERKG
ncbi:MAG: pantetheine-phosphate adenylyltransferase [Eubacteriales bacterium]|nr:pantetheine-phosphate adenylyltransferase [Eubacteriales bacterium]